MSSSKIKISLCIIIQNTQRLGLLLAIVGGFAMLQSGVVKAQSPSITILNDNEIELVKNTTTFGSKDRALTAVQIFEIHDQGHFTPVDNDTINFGSTGYTYWLYNRIQSTRDSEQQWLYDLDHVRMVDFGVYVRREGRIEILTEVKGTDPMSARLIHHRLLLAKINTNPNETLELLVKFKSHGSTSVRPRLSNQQAFNARDVKATMFHSIIIGALAALMVYNLILAVMLKSISHAWYVLFVGAGLGHVAQQSGLTFVYLWPDSGAFNAMAANFFGTITILFVLIFFRGFLNLKVTDKTFDIITRILIVGVCIAIVVSTINSQPYIGKVSFTLASLAALTNIIASLRAYQRGFKPARFAAVAWVGVLAGTAYVALSVNGIIPNFVDTNIINEISLLFEGVLFSASLSDLVTDIRVSRDEANNKLIASLRAETESSKKASYEAAQKAMALSEAAAKGHALSTVSHDIRQPIHALKLYIQGINNTEDKKLIRYGVEQMGHTITSLEQLLSSIMDSAEPESNGELIVNERFSVNRLISSTHLIFEPMAIEKGLTFKSVPSSIELYTDRGVMMRILNNLVSNAVKYTDQGKILIGCRRCNGQAIIQVLDTGRGIAEELSSTIFDNYTRLNIAKESEDSYGLGLTIVQQLADRIGADIRMHSKPGIGTMFAITLPLYEPTNTYHHDNGKSVQLRGKTALVIDDNPITLDELVGFIEDFGISCVKGATLSEVLNQQPSDNWKPDFIISDLHLANGLSGIDQAKVAYDHFEQHLPTIIVTFNRLAEAKQKVAALDDAKLIYKPVDPDTLHQVLLDLL